MLLKPMRCKDYTWPHNPETYTVEYRRQVAAHKVPFGRYVMQDLGITYRILQGEGTFAGNRAYEQFQELAAVFVARTSDLGDENLGSYLEPDDLQLSLVAHMEIAMVRRAYRGNGLQKKLMEAAEEQLRSAGFRWLMGTAHPDNVYSVHNFEQLGYKLVTKALKYGGLPRYIFCKKI